MNPFSQAILFITATALPVFAGNFPHDTWGPSYLKDVPRAIDFVESHAAHLSVEPPPADDSEITRSEIVYLKKIAENRSSRDIIQITKENLNPHKPFYNVLGLEPGESPELDLLVQRINAESYLPVLYFKHKFSRTRPYQIDESLTTVIDGPPHASYPSGHATQGYLFSLILSELLPADDPRVSQLAELGKGMGIRREIAGVHYPSDTKAGVELAIQLKAWMMGKPEFNEAFLAAKTALNQARKQ